MFARHINKFLIVYRSQNALRSYDEPHFQGTRYLRKGKAIFCNLPSARLHLYDNIATVHNVIFSRIIFEKVPYRNNFGSLHLDIFISFPYIIILSYYIHKNLT